MELYQTLVGHGQRPRGRWRKIQYTGLGAKESGLHTKAEFLQIMRDTFPENVYWRTRGDTEILPGKIKKGDIYGWMALVDARYV